MLLMLIMCNRLIILIVLDFLYFSLGYCFFSLVSCFVWLLFLSIMMCLLIRFFGWVGCCWLLWQMICGVMLRQVCEQCMLVLFLCFGVRLVVVSVGLFLWESWVQRLLRLLVVLIFSLMLRCLVKCLVSLYLKLVLLLWFWKQVVGLLWVIMCSMFFFCMCFRVVGVFVLLQFVSSRKMLVVNSQVV